MADSKNRKISNAYLPPSGQDKLKKERYEYLDSSEIISLIDSDYVIGIVDSSYLSGFIDSDYVSARQSGGGFNIEYFTTTGSVTKVGTGDVLVEIAGGGGGGRVGQGNSPARGGNSHGRAILTNVADGSVITISAIGAGGNNGSGSPASGGGTTVLYVDSANGQSVSMGGGGPGYFQSIPGTSDTSTVQGTPAVNPTVTGGAISLYGWNDGTAGGEVKNTGFGKYSGNRPVGRGIGGYQASSFNFNGTAGAVLLIGV